MPRTDSSRTPNSASQMIDQRIRELGDWRGSVLKRMRELIHEADPEVVEEWKWRKESSPGTPVWADPRCRRIQRRETEEVGT